MPQPQLAAPPVPDQDLIGRVISDKYQVHKVIGGGGMGTVYEAQHTTIGRRVAIKVLNRAHIGKREAVARFYQEARAAGAIGHPNICEIYDVGKLPDGSPYLVMERLHGKTLSDRINLEGALPFEDVITILTQVLSGLVAAHQKGIIHRDIKPENIFLTERVGCVPVVKILDFGISKTQSAEPSLALTQMGVVMGTPFYMAPEQARGEAIDHRIDLFACGIILYEMLTGRRPFSAPNYNALVMQVLSAEPRDPREIRPAIPSGFLPVLKRAMTKDRNERYPDAATFLHALAAVREEITRGPTAAEIALLAQETHRSHRPPPLVAPLPVPPAPRSPSEFDIPVVVAETETGAQELEPAPARRPHEPAAFAPVGIDAEDPEPLSQSALEYDEEEELDEDEDEDDEEEEGPSYNLVTRRSKRRVPTNEVHDTIVDPSGRILADFWAQMRPEPKAPPPANAQAPTPGRTPSPRQAIPPGPPDPASVKPTPPASARVRTQPGVEDAGRYSVVSEPTSRPASSRPAPPLSGMKAPTPQRARVPSPNPRSPSPNPRSPSPNPRAAVPLGRPAIEQPMAPRPAAAPRPERTAARVERNIIEERPIMAPRAQQPIKTPPRPPVRPVMPYGAAVPSEELDDDAVTTLFIASESGPRAVSDSNRPSATPPFTGLRPRPRADSSPTSPSVPRGRPPNTGHRG